ncbi:MAG: hypothetical protein AAGF85_20470 [Bacteroidota bacterium]
MKRRYGVATSPSLAIWQKALIVGQLIISAKFVGMYLYATVTG